MDFTRILWILAILLRFVGSRFVEDQIDCGAIRCQPIQCPDDSYAIEGQWQPSIDLTRNDDYVTNQVDDGTLLLHEDELEDDTIPEETEDDIMEESVMQSDRQSRRHTSDSRHFYVEPSEKDDKQQGNKTVAKRSLQYKRRESIKIVPGDYKSLIPSYGHNHHKWKREAAAELNDTNKSIQNAATNPCCPEQTCVCKQSCDTPICTEDQVRIEVRPGNQSQPGECCPLGKCILKPDCAIVNTTNTTWIQEPCRSCQCLSGHQICHNICGEEEETHKTCLSSILKQHFHDGEDWYEGECTHCQCHAGERKCQTSLCKPLECREKIKISGECCPVCATTSTSTATPTSTEDQSIPSTSTVERTSTSTGSAENTTSVNEDQIRSNMSPTFADTNNTTNQTPCKTGDDQSIPSVMEGPKTDYITYILYVAVIVLILTSALFAYLWYRKVSDRKTIYDQVPSCESNLNRVSSPIQIA